MNKEERILKYINTADELTFSGKRYYENDFYDDVENLVKENKKYKEAIDRAIEYLEAKRIREKVIVDIDVLEGILKEVE